MKKMLVFIAMLTGGGGIGYIGAKLILGDRDPEAVPLLPDGYGIYLVLLLPLFYLLVVGVHELGHVAAGKWQNFNFYNLTIGPFSWKPDENGRISFGWNTNLNLAGGVAVMLPGGDEDLRKRFMWFAAGGPLASLLMALLFMFLGAVFDGSFFLRFAVYVIAALSGVIFIATMIPVRAAGFASDGLRILTFARNDATAMAELAGLRAIGHLRTGKPYAELPAVEMAAVSANEKIPEAQRVTMDYYRYLHALGTENTPQAKALYAAVLERLEVFPEAARGNFYLEEALFKAKYLKDLPAAEEALNKVTKSPFTEVLGVHLANAAIAELRGDYVALSAELPGIEKGLPRSIDQSRVPEIRSWLAEWEALAAANGGPATKLS